MNRRAYLAGITTSALSVSGCTAPGNSSSEDVSRPDYWDDADVVYDHDDLVIEPSRDSVRLGNAIEFEVANTGTSGVPLGCNNPWAIQAAVDGGWRHVTWTAGRYYTLCLTSLVSGESKTVAVTMSEPELERHAAEFQADLDPGRYRFVLLGPRPFLAREFTVLDPDESV